MPTTLERPPVPNKPETWPFPEWNLPGPPESDDAIARRNAAWASFAITYGMRIIENLKALGMEITAVDPSFGTRYLKVEQTDPAGSPKLGPWFISASSMDSTAKALEKLGKKDRLAFLRKIVEEMLLGFPERHQRRMVFYDGVQGRLKGCPAAQSRSCPALGDVSFHIVCDTLKAQGFEFTMG
jgi:hypothetical protein